MKMKTKSVLLMSLIMLSSLLAVSSIAKHPTVWENYAFGTLEKYNADPGLSAELVDGIWNLKVKDDTVWFYACYQERNLDAEEENSPEGSIDILEFTLQGQPFWMGNVEMGVPGVDTALGKAAYVVFGKFQLKKTWAIYDGTYTSRTWKTWMAVEIYEDGDFLLNNWPSGLSDWDQVGEVTYSDL